MDGFTSCDSPHPDAILSAGHFLPTDRVGHWGVLNGKDAGKDFAKFEEIAPALPKVIHLICWQGGGCTERCLVLAWPAYLCKVTDQRFLQTIKGSGRRLTLLSCCSSANGWFA